MTVLEHVLTTFRSIGSKMSEVPLNSVNEVKKGLKEPIGLNYPTRNTLFKWQALEMLGFMTHSKNRTVRTFVHTTVQGGSGMVESLFDPGPSFEVQKFSSFRLVVF